MHEHGKYPINVMIYAINNLYFIQRYCPRSDRSDLMLVLSPETLLLAITIYCLPRSVKLEHSKYIT